MTDQEITLAIEGFKLGSTFALGLLVAWIAFQQWQTAKNKLALDLFDRRFKNFVTWNTIQSKRVEEIHVAHPLDLVLGERLNWDEDAYTRAIEEARYLFGAEIEGKIRDADRLIDEIAAWKGTVDDEGAQNYRTAFNSCVRLRALLFDEVDRYMLLDKIAVSQPDRRRT